MTTETWTIGRLLRWTIDYLTQAGVEEPRLSAELLLAHALSCAKIQLYARFEEEPDDERRAAFRDLVRRAAEHQPIAYLVGHKEFYSLDFEVSPDVLIPRPETEALVDQAIARCQTADRAPVHVLDMGTGSGCIVIAILSRVPQVRAVGSDISPGALAVARRNAERHKVADRLQLVEADRLDLPGECIPAGGFDLIVSNPPYIADRDLEVLPRNVRDYEPRVALAAGDDGLTFYSTLHDAGPSALTSDGQVLVEICAGLEDEVRRVMESEGVFRHTGTWRDQADPHDRVMQFALQADAERRAD